MCAQSESGSALRHNLGPLADTFYPALDSQRGLNERNGDFATASARSLRVAFVLIVIFLVRVVFLAILLFSIWLFSKEEIGGY